MNQIVEEIAVKLDLTTRARMKIVTYLFEHLSRNGNVLKITIRELSETINVCTNTVTLTLKKLEQEDIIKRRTGAIMLNSDVLYRCHTRRGQDESDHCDVNINIQMKQKYESERHPNRKEPFKTREENRETAFAALSLQKNAEALEAYKHKLNEREKALRVRESACDARALSIMEKEKTLREWEKRIDSVLGLKSTKGYDEPSFSLT